jgi:hypothetical protein
VFVHADCGVQFGAHLAGQKRVQIVDERVRIRRVDHEVRARVAENHGQFVLVADQRVDVELAVFVDENRQHDRPCSPCISQRADQIGAFVPIEDRFENFDIESRRATDLGPRFRQRAENVAHVAIDVLPRQVEIQIA